MKKAAAVAGAMLMLMWVGIAGVEAAQPAGNAAGSETVKKQTVCPVMGGQINTNIYVDANGKRVYFCCNGCPAEFKKDPAKFIAKMEKDGVELEKAPVADEATKPSAEGQTVKRQTVCPVTGEEINRKLFVDYEGKRIYVCCKGCLHDVKKDPAKYVKKLEDQGVTLDKTPAADEVKKPKTNAEATPAHGHDQSATACGGGCCK